MGSPPFATPILEALHASRHDIAALITPPDRPRGRGRVVEPSDLVVRARELGIPVVQPETTRDESFTEELRALEPEVILVASYGEILRDNVLNGAPHGCLNVHGSLLPRHRGAAPIQKAILDGDEETGVSIQRIVPALDEGDVLLEKRTAIGSRETAGDLFERLSALGAEAAVEALDVLESGKAVFTPQDHSQATYAKKLKKVDGRIDWNRTRAEVDRTVRGLTPWPGARTSFVQKKGHKELVILAVSEIELEALDPQGQMLASRGAPGTVLEADKRLVVMAGDAPLSIDELKPAGKQAMDAASFLRGARLEAGTRLGGRT